MSKSKGNVVSADGLAEEYGADTARLFSFFGGPYDMDLEWSNGGRRGLPSLPKARLASGAVPNQPG